MLKQFFSLIGLKKDHRIEAEGYHPIGRQEIEQRPKTEIQCDDSEYRLDRKDDVQIGETQVMVQDSRNALSVDFGLARQSGLNVQPIPESGQSSQFSDQLLPGLPGQFVRRLSEEPGCESVVALCGRGRVEKMEERVRPNHVEVARVEMGVGCDGIARREYLPIKAKPGKVLALDPRPQREPMNPVFEPVMIRGDRKKSDEEQQERPVAGIVVFQPVETHGDEQSGQKQDASPAGELCAGLCAAPVQTLAPLQ